MAGIWHPLLNQPPFHTSTMILLTDGRVMVQEEATPHWYAFSPDPTGDYLAGTWSPLADMAVWRRYYASGITRDGRVLVVGGEQSGAGGDTNRGEIYDPVADTWTPIPPPPWSQVGDAASCILPDGKLLIGALTTPDCLIYDPGTDSWSSAAAKAVRSNEETWILLADETMLTVQCWDPFRSERYSISSNAWKDEGKPPVQLVDPVMHEIGPAMLLYTGQVIYFGAANSHGWGRTAIYTPPASYTGTGVWSAGPDLPRVRDQTIVCNDCPAALMPNGKVLVTGAPYRFNDWGTPVYFFEYDPFANRLIQAPTPPNNGAQLYWSRLMLLPTGDVLFSPSSDNVQCYRPDGQPQEAWRPMIREVVAQCRLGAPSYLVRGTQLTGLSQANIYGDDCSAATSYPLARLRHLQSGEVFYCRTADFSSLAVATGGTLESVRLDASRLPYGEFDLAIIANGISSHSVRLCHRACQCEKRAGGCCGGSVPDGRCCEEVPMDGRVIQLGADVRALRREVQRLGERTGREAVVREPKEQREVSEADRRAAEEEAVEEEPGGGRPESGG